MAHRVKGLIAKPKTLETFASKHFLRPPIALSAGLAILPLRDVDLDSFLKRPFSSDPDDVYLLSEEFIDELRTASRGAALMYFETEYFGGQGVQGAAVFEDGALVFGPEAAAFGPINVALQLLGVRVAPPALAASSHGRPSHSALRRVPASKFCVGVDHRSHERWVW